MRVQTTLSRLRHLASRFFTSVRARPLTDADLQFVRSTLSAGELVCWERLGRADRAESVATARAAREMLGTEADAGVLAAALLHDVGKAETGLGPIGRAAATVVATVAGPRRARRWTNPIGRYVNHDRLGAERLRAADARPIAVMWAGVHHLRAEWPSTGIPPEICKILARADGEPVSA